MIFNYPFLLLSASLLSSPVLSVGTINCASSSIFDVEIDHNRKIIIYNPKIGVSFDRQSLSVYEYPDTDAVNILINDTCITFTGQMLEETKNYEKSVKTSWIHRSNIVGTARLIKRRYGHTTMSECEVYIDRNFEQDSNPPIKMQIEILHQAAACVRASLCTRLGKITPKDTRNAKRHPYTFGLLSASSKSLKDQRENRFPLDRAYDPKYDENSDFLTSLITTLNQLDLSQISKIDEVGSEENINELVDSVLAKIIEQIKQQHKETMKLPQIEQKFPFGEFVASNGLFSDLSTMRRTADASLTHSGLKYLISSNFGLTKAEIKYNSYKITSLFSAAGSFMAKVTGASAAVIVTMDYSVEPCKSYLQNLHVNNIGHIDISFTGLGPFSHLASSIARWVVDTWQKPFIAQVEGTLKEIVQDHMEQFDCEKYRPKTYF